MLRDKLSYLIIVDMRITRITFRIPKILTYKVAFYTFFLSILSLYSPGTPSNERISTTKRDEIM